MNLIDTLTDRHGRAVALHQRDDGAHVYSLPGLELVRAVRDDEGALELMGMHDAPPVSDLETEQKELPDLRLEQETVDFLSGILLGGALP